MIASRVWIVAGGPPGGEVFIPKPLYSSGALPETDSRHIVAHSVSQDSTAHGVFDTVEDGFMY